jgi:hypothetical protein
MLTVALLVMVLTPFVPAAAGGPTSALLSVPGEGATASLYYTDPEYDALARMVGIDSGSGFGTVDRSGADHGTGPGVTVTWLIHDVTPWRVDHVYLSGDGAPWIATQLLGVTGTGGDGSVVWHQPQAGAELAALLDRLGVGEAARGAGEFTGVQGAPLPPAPDPGAAASAPEEAAPAERSGAGGTVAAGWWALAGLLVGVLATTLLMRARGRGAAHPAAPTGPDDVPEDPVPAAGEQVSWPAPQR